MYEAILTFFGVLVGAGIALLGTYLTIKSNYKLEVRKMKLSFLMDKKKIMENFLNSSDYELPDKIEQEQDMVMICEEYLRIQKFLYTKSHYFLNSDDCDKCLIRIKEIDNYKDETQLYLAYLMRDVARLFRDFLSEELISTVSKMEEIMD